MSGKSGPSSADAPKTAASAAGEVEEALLLRLDETARRIAERSLEVAEATNKTIAEMTLRSQQLQIEALDRTALAVARLLPPSGPGAGPPAKPGSATGSNRDTGQRSSESPATQG